MPQSPHILIAIGTRPEAIKLAPVILALREARARHTVVAVAQHRELLDRALASFEIEPDLDLDVMADDQNLDALTARILGRMHEVFESVRPDLVVVQGDTTSAVTCALAAHHAELAVAHVEAGLRTSSIAHPWPEEANRRVITRLSTLHFAPTDHARDNLLAEGVAAEAIEISGNTGVDAVRLTTAVHSEFPADTVLITCHRRENQRDDFRRATAFIRSIAAAYPERLFVLPAHPSPRVVALTSGIDKLHNVTVLPPLDYPEMLGVIRAAQAVVTDSGGVQEECAHFGTPCLVTREETDRPESVEAGNAVVVSFDVELAIRELAEPVRRPCDVFGDGQASARIVRRLIDL